ncbi:hypothetical protein ScPMuIL_013626 [Solemya velum]
MSAIYPDADKAINKYHRQHWPNNINGLIRDNNRTMIYNVSNTTTPQGRLPLENQRSNIANHQLSSCGMRRGNKRRRFGGSWLIIKKEQIVGGNTMRKLNLTQHSS